MRYLVIAIAVALLSACAAAPPPPEVFDAAERAIEAAERANAEELSPVELRFARERLDRLLSGFSDVPALRREHGATAERLILLLPERLRPRAALRYDDLVAGSPSPPSVPVFWLLMILLALAQLLYFGLAGAGE